jgi:hypothetical protein
MSIIIIILISVIGACIGYTAWNKIKEEWASGSKEDELEAELRDEIRREFEDKIEYVDPWNKIEDQVPRSGEIVLVRPYAGTNAGIPVPGVWVEDGYWRVFDGNDLLLWKPSEVDAWTHIDVQYKEVRMT